MRLTADAHRCELALDGAGGLHRQTEVAPAEAHDGAIGQALGDTDHRNGQLLQQAVSGLVPDQRGQATAAESFAGPDGHAGQAPGPQFQGQMCIRDSPWPAVQPLNWA